MNADWELDEGIKLIKSTWWREHMARINLEKMFEQANAENEKLRELVLHVYTCMGNVDADGNHECFSCEYEGAECDYDRRMRELGVEVDG